LQHNGIATQKSIPGPEEFFSDSLNIGQKNLNIIEISKFRTTDSNYVIINFYSKKETVWILKNTFEFLKDGILSCDPNFNDFNNDGLNDFTYVSGISARGANSIRKLFLYQKESDQLIYIKNSDEFPNLHYNKDLNCIDAFRVYAGCMTEFLTIKGDSLKPFASVELYNGLTVIEYDQNGNGKVL
jgi:hypothetical protein